MVATSEEREAGQRNGYGGERVSGKSMWAVGNGKSVGAAPKPQRVRERPAFQLLLPPHGKTSFEGKESVASGLHVAGTFNLGGAMNTRLLASIVAALIASGCAKKPRLPVAAGAAPAAKATAAAPAEGGPASSKSPPTTR